MRLQGIDINIILLIFFLFTQSSQATELGSEIPGFLSGNYEIKKLKKKNRNSSSQEQSLNREKNRLPSASEISENVTQTNESPNNSPNTDSVKIGEKLDQKVGVEASYFEPTLGDQVKSVFSSHEGVQLNSYFAQIHPEDIRHNQMEFDLRAGFVSHESSSNFSYRKYSAQFSAFDVGTNLWLAPGFGIFGKLLYSVGASIENNDAVLAHTPAEFESLLLGLKLRKFFGAHRKSSSVEAKIFVIEDQVKVPADDTQRLRLKTSGLGVGLKVYTPYSNNWTYFIGGNFAPRMEHSEMLTGVKNNSGTSSKTTRIGLDLGFEVKLDRQNQFLFEANLVNEKNLFSGEAGGVDPLTSVRPTNVAVSNTIFSMMIGYRWGK